MRIYSWLSLFSIVFVVSVTLMLPGSSTLAQPSEPPPPASRCTDENYLPISSVRTQVPDQFRDVLHCRIIMAGGSYTIWNRRALYHVGTVGNIALANLGLIAVVDVFSPQGLREFNDVVLCMRGAGEIFLLNDTFTTSPRVAVATTAWTTDAFPGFTCATLYQPATVVMVRRQPTEREREIAAAQTAAASPTLLASCTLDLTYTVRLRQLPTQYSATLTRIAYNKVVEADARSGDWFRVNWFGQIGWVHGDYAETTEGCA